MKVKDLMSRHPRVCAPDETLEAAAIAMWHGDCGVLPVTENGRIVGMITDRDICMATALQGRRPSEIRVREVIGKELYSCSPDDELGEALETMRAHQVRRVPVLDPQGRAQGVLSLNDVALVAAAQPGKQKAPTYKDLAQTLHAICEHRVATAVA